MTSVAFALAHVEPLHMFFALAAGFYLGWISDLAGSCRASLAAHAVNNTVAALGSVWMASTEDVFTTVPVVVASGLLAAGSSFWLRRRTRGRVGLAGA